MEKRELERIYARQDDNALKRALQQHVDSLEEQYQEIEGSVSTAEILVDPALMA